MTTHVDPVCGMTIEESDAVGSHVHDGVRYFFCATSCLERFKADPRRVRAASGSATGSDSRDDLLLSDGSGDPPDRSRRVPEVRHGARA